MSNIEIPEFLLEMSHQLNTQDNRITADPIWQVRCKRWRVTADGFSDTFHIFNHADCDTVAESDNDTTVNEQILTYMVEGYGHSDWAQEWALENGAQDGMTERDLLDIFHESFDPKCDDLPDNMELHWMEQYEDVVKTCLTEADANWFINRKQHDYPPLYTYVESMCYCPQMIELRNWIKSLNQEAK